MESSEITYGQFLDKMKELREISSMVFPEKFKLVCMQEGIKESTSMDMYHYFKMIVKGEIPYVNNRPLEDEQIAKIIDLGIKSKMMYENNNHHRIDYISSGNNNWGDNFSHCLVVWSPKGSDEKISTEVSFTSSDAYVTIGKMIDNGNTIHCILKQVDDIYSTNGCMSLEPNERGKKHYKVYDGDVILAYLERPKFWDTDAKDCGLYICNNGAYRKLLYTPGKGYVRKGKPDVDDELEVTYEDGAFNNHILTMSQKWEKIGNINVDSSFLIEKQD